MSEKLPVLLAYTLFGLFLGLAPIIASHLLPPPRLSENSRRDASPLIIFAVLSVAGLALLPVGNLAFILAVGSLSLAAGFQTGNWKAAVCAFGAIIASATLPWWRYSEKITIEVSWAESTVFFLVAAFAFRVLSSQADNNSVKRNTAVILAASGIYVFFAGWLSFSTGIYESSDTLQTAWHHWGAYIGPSQVFRAGARLFYDIPSQYGLGPTAIVAWACGYDCLIGTYFVVGAATLASGSIIAYLALAVSGKGLKYSQLAVILLLVLLSCFLWTGYPANVTSSITTPSIFGMRFLPVLLLITILFTLDRGSHAPRSFVWGHAAWVIGFLWSPESAFLVTFVWWPYYLWQCHEKGLPGVRAIYSLLRPMAVLGALLLAVAAVFMLTYRLVYNVNPTIYGFLAYVIDPPGPLPIDPKGTIWFFLAFLAVGLAALYHKLRTDPQGPETRRMFLLVLLAYGSFFYFLGRSHNNSILNQAPYMLLVLLGARQIKMSELWRVSANVMLASLIAYSTLFGWEAWTHAYQAGHAFEVRPSLMPSIFTYENGSNKNKRLANANRVIKYLWDKYKEPITILDEPLLLITTEAGEAWSAIHGPENFISILSASRREFLLNTMRRLNRTGWLLVNKNFYVRNPYPSTELLGDFDSVYLRAEVIDFGAYFAIRYMPNRALIEDYANAEMNASR